MGAPLRTISGSFLMLAAAVAFAQPDGLRGGTDKSRTTLSGRVERVYASEKQISNDQTDTLFAIEILLITPTDAITDRKTVFVKTWRATKRPEGTGGPLGQTNVPSRGDIVECDVTGGPGTFVATIPDGIRIVIPGSFKSEVTSLEMALIDAGEFLMGSTGTESNRRPDELLHRVKITQRFYLGIHEVTQAEYKYVMQTRPSAFSFSGASKDKVFKTITDRYPVESVSWFDAVEFCNRLSKRDGLKPYYNIADAKSESDSIVEANVSIAGGSGYRLPTEAEWEYVCRAGTSTPFHYGQESQLLTANVKALAVPSGGYGTVPKFKELGRTTKVGSYPANDWGLFDMHGNAAEWCQDWYDKNYYADSPIDDPKGPEQGTHKVLRGGSWMVNDANCRSAARFFHLPRELKYYGGFRVARTP